jgi:hypothetical protein
MDVKDRPLFHPLMVLPVLAGLKTNTRRMSGLNCINESPNDYKLENLRLQTFKGIQRTTAFFFTK